MPQLDKLVEKARRSPRNIRYQELVKILCRVGGYEFNNQVGSHCVYRKNGQYSIALTKTPGLAKVEEVKKVVSRLEEEGLI
jgi:hypothetical protein